MLKKPALVLMAVLLLPQYLFAAEATKDEKQPNIIILLCDDLGYGDLECYGHPKIKTPNLNQLAAEGIRFTDCYSAAPVCSPSRVGLLTGRNPNRAGVFDWIPPANAKTIKPDGREQVHLRREEITISALLKSAGYATCMAGKWHCNSRFNEAVQPQPGDFGFDHWLATQNNAAPNHQNPTNFVRNGTPIGKVESFSCNFVAKEAADWLTKHHAENPKQPFFIYAAFHEPHERVASPKYLVDQYLPVAENEDQAQYFANVANLDVAVGSLLDALDEMELTDDTLVIFTSDNGPETLNRYQTANRSWGVPTPLRGMKLHTNEAGSRVAGIMRWPEAIKPNQVSEEPVSALDFLPTLSQLAGIDLVQTHPDLKLDGADFIPALSNRKIIRAQPLFWCYYNSVNEARMSMRDGDLKVLGRIVQPDGTPLKKTQNVTVELMKKIKACHLEDIEIYDLTKDVSEEHNLDKTDPVLLQASQQKLTEVWQELNENSHVWTLNEAARKK